MGSKKSLNSCPRCGAPWRKFDDNWDTFRCGLQRNVCSGYILESEGCLESVIEDRDARIAALTEELERVRGMNKRLQETVDYLDCEREHAECEVTRLMGVIEKLAIIESLPAAEPKALLDPDEVKAVLAEALAPQPMAKVWAEAAINAMCGKVVGEPDAGERVRRLTEAKEITAALYKPFHKAECECAICFDWHEWHQRVINGE